MLYLNLNSELFGKGTCHFYVLLLEKIPSLISGGFLSVNPQDQPPALYGSRILKISTFQSSKGLAYNCADENYLTGIPYVTPGKYSV